MLEMCSGHALICWPLRSRFEVVAATISHFFPIVLSMSMSCVWYNSVKPAQHTTCELQMNQESSFVVVGVVVKVF